MAAGRRPQRLGLPAGRRRRGAAVRSARGDWAPQAPGDRLLCAAGMQCSRERFCRRPRGPRSPLAAPLSGAAWGRRCLGQAPARQGLRARWGRGVSPRGPALCGLAPRLPPELRSAPKGEEVWGERPRTGARGSRFYTGTAFGAHVQSESAKLPLF